MKRVLLGLILVASASLSAGTAAAAPTPPCLSCDGEVAGGAEAAGDVINVNTEKKAILPSDDVPARRTVTPGGEASARTEWVELEEEYVTPACFRNGLQGDDALCQAAVTTCGPGRLRFWIWHRYVDARRNPDGTVTRTERPWEQLPGSYCLGGDDPGAPNYARAIAEIERGFAQLPLPTSGVEVAPAPTSLVRVPTAFYAGGEQSFEQTVSPAGVTVTVRAEPTSWTWHWGDGSPPQTFTTPGVPRRPVVAHTYDAARDYSARVVVTWKGTFTIAGSAEVFEIANEASVTSAPVTVQVREARTQLVDRG